MAEPQKTGDSAWVEDFEDGSLADWDYDPDTPVEVVRTGDNALLHVRQAGELTLADRGFTTLTLEVTVQGEGGVRFGDKYEVLLTASFGGSLRVSERRGSKTADLALVKGKYEAGATHRLKVVSAGSLLRVLVDGERGFEKTDAGPVKGSISLVAGEKGAVFDNLRVSAAVLSEDGTVAVPKAEAEALVFPAATEAAVEFDAVNASDKEVRLVAAVRPFRGEPVAESESSKGPKGGTVVEFGVRKFFRIKTLAEQTVAAAEAAVKAGSRGTSQVSLGKLPAGFYMLDTEFACGEANWRGGTYPLAVLEEPARRNYAPPVFPVAVYTKLMQYTRTTEPLWWKTYIHAIAHDLARHRLNTVVACGAFEPETVEIFNRYGIAVLERGSHCIDHPGVIGTLIGDEPNPENIEELRREYETLRAKTDKLLLTCMVGDSIGVGGAGDALNLWKALQPRTRCFRWYGVKKSFYGVQRHAIYKGVLPFTSVLRIVQAAEETPYWVVLPAFGTTEHEAYFQRPSPAELRSMMHLALAYGAKGLLLFGYQGDGKFAGMVDAVTLQPEGGLLAAAGEVAMKIGKHAALIRSLRFGGLDIRCPSLFVEAVPVRDGGDGRYVYAVNKNPKEPVTTRLLLWAETWELSGAQDVFNDEKLKVERDEEGYWSVPVTFEPGGGKLLSMSVKDRK